MLFVLCLPVFAGVAFVWAGVLIAGFFMVLYQVLFVIAMSKLRPGVGDGVTEGGSRGSVGGVGSGSDPDPEQSSRLSGCAVCEGRHAVV
jgi:hypothetical protein